jgi:hypothetical protein
MQFIPTTFFEQGTLFRATGGITGSYNDGIYEYTYHKFISGSNTFTITSGDGYIDILLVGGGGRGGFVGSPALNGNGGGGGGVLQNNVIYVKGGENYTLSIGTGGISGSTDGVQTFMSGSNLGLFASGGLSNGTSGNGYLVGVAGNCGGAATPGGGGSSTQNGFNGVCTPTKAAGAGGQGIAYSLGGPSIYYGSGGGGGIETNTTAAAGGSGAGNGGTFSLFAGSGSANQGGGGGGDANNQKVPGNGGSGVAIIRYISKVL